MAPGLDLPKIERLEIVIPPPQRTFDDTLPSFLEQPTPVLEVIIPEHEPSVVKPPRRRVRVPTPAKMD
jgi:hypothetical protein